MHTSTITLKNKQQSRSIYPGRSKELIVGMLLLDLGRKVLEQLLSRAEEPDVLHIE